MEKINNQNSNENSRGGDILVAFDRDDTLIYDTGFFGKEDDWKDLLQFYEGAFEAVRELNSFADVVVVTNQAGVIHGHYDEQRTDEINQYIDLLFKEQGAFVDGWYKCPPLDLKAIKQKIEETLDYSLNDLLRLPKPGIGMLKQAALDLGKKLAFYKEVYVVGDKATDVQSALNAGGIGIWFYNGKNGEALEKVKKMENENPGRVFYVTSLLKAAEIIKSQLTINN